jgi:hypothetical protein
MALFGIMRTLFADIPGLAGTPYVDGWGDDGFGGSGGGGGGAGGRGGQGVSGGNSIDPSAFFAGIEEAKSKGYIVGTANFFISNNGSLYGGLGYYDPSDETNPTFATNYRISENYSSDFGHQETVFNNNQGSNGWQTANTVSEVATFSTDLTIHGTFGAQILANSLSNTSNEIINLGEKNLVKGLSVEAASRYLGAASVGYNVVKLLDKPSWGRGLETVISGVSLVPGWGWAVGATYFVADMISEGTTGKINCRKY